MKTNTKQIIIWVIVIALFVAGMAWMIAKDSVPAAPAGPSIYDGFAQCIKDSGATFYGAFWCPHCAAEKALFGTSVHLLPYVECSTPDGNSQTQICIDKKITGYPTWIFKDGSILTGTIPLDQLAAKTGCVLPTGAVPANGGSPDSATSTSSSSPAPEGSSAN